MTGNGVSRPALFRWDAPESVWHGTSADLHHPSALCGQAFRVFSPSQQLIRINCMGDLRFCQEVCPHRADWRGSLRNCTRSFAALRMTVPVILRSASDEESYHCTLPGERFDPCFFSSGRKEAVSSARRKAPFVGASPSMSVPSMMAHNIISSRIPNVRSGTSAARKAFPL